MQSGETKLSTQTVYDGSIIKLTVDEVSLPSGIRASREVVHHPGAVVILAQDAAERVLLVSQYRHAVERDLWELPAGKLEPGENPALAAERELAEETGFGACNWKLLYSMYTAPGFCNELLRLYQATGLRPDERDADWDECILVRAFSRNELRQMIAAGQIMDAKTLVGLLHHLSS